jgi:hypothetical protein
MARPNEVANMLANGAEYVMRGENYSDIDWLSNKPAFTETQFEAGFAKYDAWKAEQDATQVTAKANAQAKLAALGLTVEDLQALGL